MARAEREQKDHVRPGRNAQAGEAIRITSPGPALSLSDMRVMFLGVCRASTDLIRHLRSTELSGKKSERRPKDQCSILFTAQPGGLGQVTDLLWPSDLLVRDKRGVGG